MAISGGTYVILQHAAHLRNQGHSVTLAVQDPIHGDMLDWHDQARRLECVSFAEGKKNSYDLVIATWWKTALEVASFQTDCHAYFVQSIESRFYPPCEAPLRRLVDRTYELPMAYATEASWIREHLATQYGQSAALVRNGIRKDVYRASGEGSCRPTKSSGLRVLVEGHLGVPFKNTALAIKLAQRAGIRDVWLLTGSPISWIPGVRRVFSRVPMVATPAIYGACDVLLKLSTVEGMFGPPLEMFHCGGTAVVFDVTGHDEYIRNNENAIVVKCGDVEGVEGAIRRLAGDARLLESLKNGARITALQWPSWEQSSSQFEAWVNDIASRATGDTAVMREHSKAALREYQEHERERRQRNPRLVYAERVQSFVRRLPPAVKERCKQAGMVWEVISPTTRVL